MPEIPPALPPEAWRPAVAAARRIVSPIQRFLAIEAASGVLLLVAAVTALVLANSAWHGAVHTLWETPIGLGVGDWTFTRSLHFWLNDGLMTLFFFVVGLEIRREISAGELADRRRAALPIAAALGGMLIPAAIYAALNGGRAGSAGWAIPMATDIAFAVGVLTLLGNRVSPGLRVLLLTLAVIDDIGAIIVIAIFYSGGIELDGLAVVAAGITGVVLLRALGVRSPPLYVVPAAVLWFGLYRAGIHPTLAGVVLGLMTPVRTWNEGGEVVSPSVRLQHLVHRWVAFGIMPLFALANGGVELGGARLDGDAWFVFAGILVGLALGKPIGVVAASRAAIATGVSVRPRDITLAGLAVVGSVAGVGFTMSIFIAQLAFPAGPLLATAKLAILAGSGASIIAGMLAGALVLRPTIRAASEAPGPRDHGETE